MHVLSLFISVYWTAHNTHTKKSADFKWQNPKHQSNLFSCIFRLHRLPSYMPDWWFSPYRQHLHEYCIKINHFSHFHLARTNSKHCNITNTFGIIETKNNTMKEHVKNTRQWLFSIQVRIKPSIKIISTLSNDFFRCRNVLNHEKRTPLGSQ